ncbi:L,D-transpeptidase family protein [Candidatus Thalassolituus haligoni]|uniref:L,D-transpeptidase family protein n=1 Tax=Candidatus Thalassolituus haligoni TaxID=3100113 RepID=UPI003513CCCE|tara:strand:+ start:610 stop:1161 length:552 start_codon:yes stop_codon:yes gene_type:complete
MPQQLPPSQPVYDETRIDISIADQQLRLTTAQVCIIYPVSTALNGAGEQQNSGCTPRGWHRVAARIGAGLPANSVFIGRRFTGEVYSAALAKDFPARDWILSRILWLQGLEIGRNRMGQVDSMRRYIYIHGTPDSEPMGVPGSHGCIRMRNHDLLALFDLISTDTLVWIQAHSFARIPCRNLS